MTTYYENIGEYIEDFNINAKIVDTEERNKMCEMWEELAYSKIYLMSLCYDKENKMDYWYKESVYWTGWEWNEQNNHIHGIGTMRNLHDEDEQQKSHMVYDLSFGLILSEKRLKEKYNELQREEQENLEKQVSTDPRKVDLSNCINYISQDNCRTWSDEDMRIIYILNEGAIPGKLDIKFPRIG